MLYSGRSSRKSRVFARRLEVDANALVLGATKQGAVPVQAINRQKADR
jgi:hypothetical protein